MHFCTNDILGCVLQCGGFILGLYCWMIWSVSATFEMSNSDMQRPMETEGGEKQTVKTKLIIFWENVDG